MQEPSRMMCFVLGLHVGVFLCAVIVLAALIRKGIL